MVDVVAIEDNTSSQSFNDLAEAAINSLKTVNMILNPPEPTMYEKLFELNRRFLEIKQIHDTRIKAYPAYCTNTHQDFFKVYRNRNEIITKNVSDWVDKTSDLLRRHENLLVKIDMKRNPPMPVVKQSKYSKAEVLITVMFIIKMFYTHLIRSKRIFPSSSHHATAYAKNNIFSRKREGYEEKKSGTLATNLGMRHTSPPMQQPPQTFHFMSSAMAKK